MRLGCWVAPRRSRSASDQEAVFIPEPIPDEGVRKEIVAIVDRDLAQDVQHSLNLTSAELHWEDQVEPKERSKKVRKTYDDLEKYVERRDEEQLAEGMVHALASDDTVDLSRASTLDTRESGEPDEANEDLVVNMDSLSPEDRAKALCDAHGLDYDAMQGLAGLFLERIGMRPHEVGSRNYSKWRGRTLWNQCFYLSIAHAYLGQQAGTRRVQGFARRLRRAVEAVVLERHPGWAAGLEASTAGKGKAMVFADFLPIAMRAEGIPAERNLLAKFVVCILDSVNGHVEVYIGPGYAALQDRAEQARNLILLWYKPGHYQCLVRADEQGSKLDKTYDEFKSLLVEHGVMFIETLE